MVDVDRGGGRDRWDAFASSYGRSPIVARLAEALVDLLVVSPGEDIIDIGTGTGLALAVAARASRTGAALGIDRSRGMLEVSGVRLADADPHTAFVRADAAQIPVREASFDVAVAASVWQFLGYAPEALAEWKRVLRSDGRIGFSVPGPGSGASIPSDLMNKYFSRLAPLVQDDFLSRRSRPLPDLAEAAAEAGFGEARVVARSWDDTLPSAEDWWAIQWTHAVRFFLQGLDPAALDQLKHEAIERLTITETGAVTVTTSVLYCTARR